MVFGNANISLVAFGNLLMGTVIFFHVKFLNRQLTTLANLCPVSDVWRPQYLCSGMVLVPARCFLLVKPVSLPFKIYLQTWKRSKNIVLILFLSLCFSYAAIFKESYHSLFKLFPSQQDFIDANGKIDNRKVPSCYHCWRKKMHENLLFFLS